MRNMMFTKIAGYIYSLTPGYVLRLSAQIFLRNHYEHKVVGIYRFQHKPLGWMMELGAMYRLCVLFIFCLSVRLSGSFEKSSVT